MYKQLLHLKAAFGSRSSTIIVYDSLDKGRVTFAAPTNGLPPGHPLCGFLAAIPVKVAWAKSVESVRGDFIRSNGNPQPGSTNPAHVGSGWQFDDSFVAHMFVDDGGFYGHKHTLPKLLGVFIDTSFANGAGVINYRKTVVERLDRHPVSREVTLAVAIALATPPDRDRVNAASLEFVRGASPGVAVIPHPLDVAESVLGCVPTVVYYPPPSSALSGVMIPDIDVPNTAGGSVVGAFHGTDQYLRAKATTKQAEAVLANLARLDAFPNAHSWFFLVRQCIAASLVQSARAHGMSPIFMECSFVPVNDAIISIAKMVSEIGFDPIQLRLLFLPLRHGGIGLQHTSQTAPNECMACQLFKTRRVLPRMILIHLFH